MSLWKIAWRSIQQRSLASTLTAISMALGVALVVTVLVVHGVLEESFTRGAQGYHLVVGKKGSQLQLVLNTVYHLQESMEPLPYSFYKEFTATGSHKGKYAGYVELAIPYCLGDNYQGFRVVGTVPELFDKLEYSGGKHYEFQPGGRNIDADHFFEAVVGAEAARKTGLKVGDEFQPTHDLGNEGDGHKHDAFQVVGILEPTGTANDRALFINIEGFYLLDNHAKPVEETPARPTPKVVRVHADADKDHAHDHAADHKAEPHEHADDHKDHPKDSADGEANPLRHAEVKHAGEKHADDKHADEKDRAHEHADDPKAAPDGHQDDAKEPAAAPSNSAKHDAHEHDAAKPDADHEHKAASHADDHDHAEHDHAGHDHAAHAHKDETKVGDHDHKADSHAGHNHAGHDHAGHDHSAHGHDHAHHTPLPEDQREVTAILVLAKNDIFSQQLQRKINEGLDAQAASPIKVVQEFFAQMVSSISYVLLALTILIMVEAGVGIMVSIYNSMSDRRREIAVMRALGAGRRTVLTVVLLESILLSVGGGVLGFLLGHGLVAAVSPWAVAKTGVSLGFLQFAWFDLTMGRGTPLMIPYEVILIPALVVLASLVGFLPAMSAYRTDVAKALTASP